MGQMSNAYFLSPMQLTKSLLFHQKPHFLPSISLSTKASHFWPKFRFLTKSPISFYQKSNYLFVVLTHFYGDTSAEPLSFPTLSLSFSFLHLWFPLLVHNVFRERGKLGHFFLTMIFNSHPSSPLLVLMHGVFWEIKLGHYYLTIILGTLHNLKVVLLSPSLPFDTLFWERKLGHLFLGNFISRTFFWDT